MYSDNKMKKISVVVSLAGNIVYSIVETMLIKTGKSMPIEIVRFDGDCINVYGIYWRQLMLTPAMSVNDSNPGANMIEKFSIMRFVLFVALFAFIIWLVLTCIYKIKDKRENAKNIYQSDDK